jgi:two-component system, chemotaxis family, CheB/CheR fusion protein
MGLAVAVLDRSQRVQIWNGNARELWGVAADEAEDEHLMALDIGLPVEKLRQQVRDTLGGQSPREEVVVEATNRRGKASRAGSHCFRSRTAATAPSPARS